MKNLVILAQQDGPQVYEIADWAPVWVVGLLLFLGLVGFSYGTRAGIIARATTKEAIRQPLFFLLLLISAAVLVVNTFMPFFTLGDDIRELKNCGLATLLISGVLLAVWTAGTSITNEIDGKTAMTLLSKPITRRQFVLGKYIGIVQAVLWLFLPMMLLMAFLIFYKVGYDQKEASSEVAHWIEWTTVAGGVELPSPNPVRMAAVSQVLPGVVLCFFQVCVLGAISVAVATRLPMVVNLVVCFAVFVVGNLTPMMVTQGKTVIQNEFVTFVARLIATILPSLHSFDIYGVLARGGSVPPTYLGVSLLYGAAYAAATILVAFILFEDRDLA
ncbi:ABC transporter permease [Fuerstiella marisgermanici]|uniref:ABC-type transport system involved in multi-copper enzyme maturation, permease component n=1 Tax=Fuerstiella marisgermanici TaxID=1891926 RepID=A0A1P8W8R3_9PLAN|nr:ABC transporter permease subunit [Fuerstiella marisgermanici]APZ90432.1 ABC-type transport system involved in multi-copper enzyme maturation, permease component [Fuerstiella marisgermanici]